MKKHRLLVVGLLGVALVLAVYWRAGSGDGVAAGPGAETVPTLDVAANERLSVRLSFPEGTPGDRIFMELTDGGRFENTEDMGQVLEVGPDRTLSFVFFADGRGGNCGLTFRQAGHSRVIPLWVGAPQPVADRADH